MSAFEWNKVIGAILVALLVVKVADIAGESLLSAETPKKHAYPIEGVASAKPAGGEQEKKKGPEIPDIKPLLANASVAEGKKAARKCAICHNFEKGQGPKVGPNLWGKFGHEMGQGDFAFSSAMKSKKVKLTPETLNHFLYDPRKFVPGTKMAFAGIKNDKERANVIAFIHSLQDNPQPLK